MLCPSHNSCNWHCLVQMKISHSNIPNRQILMFSYLLGKVCHRTMRPILHLKDHPCIICIFVLRCWPRFYLGTCQQCNLRIANVHLQIANLFYKICIESMLNLCQDLKHCICPWGTCNMPTTNPVMDSLRFLRGMT